MNLIEFTEINGPVLALLGVLVTVFTNYVIQNKKSSITEKSSEKSSLNKEQQEFRQSILEELKNCRETAEKLKDENDELHSKALDDKSDKLKLLLEIDSLQKRIVELEIELNLIVTKTIEKE
jgi:uncharacterized coiled-coil DUF342 family protein